MFNGKREKLTEIELTPKSQTKLSSKNYTKRPKVIVVAFVMLLGVCF